MKAAVYSSYGPPDVVQITDVAKPIPNDNELLIKVHAASVNPYDWHFMRGEPYFFRLRLGLRKPKIQFFGADVAGRVETVGRNVTQFKPGDAVFGMATGAFAEFVCVAPSKLAAKPDAMTFEQAASVPIAGLTALQGPRDKGQIQPGQRVLINGAAGGVGTFAVQIAKSFGAEVTGVCSTRNVELLRSIGADHVVDYTRENFTNAAQRYNLILDCIGNHSLSACRRALTPTGTYLIVGGRTGRWMTAFAARLIKAQILSRFVSHRLLFVSAKPVQQDLATLGQLIVDGKIRPVLDRRYPLQQLPEAIRYLEEGHARGKVVITVAEDR